MNIDDVIKGYVKLRDELDARKKEQAMELAPLREKMDKIEAWLQNQLQSQGLKNFKGASGTAFLKEVTSATVQDWDATLAFIKEQDRWELLERRVAKTVVEDYVESTGEIPPGVELKRETVVQVRRG
jgi:hypothetical protein